MVTPSWASVPAWGYCVAPEAADNHRLRVKWLQGGSQGKEKGGTSEASPGRPREGFPAAEWN